MIHNFSIDDVNNLETEDEIVNRAKKFINTLIRLIYTNRFKSC